jgi:hypothetical protein
MTAAKKRARRFGAKIDSGKKESEKVWGKN